MNDKSKETYNLFNERIFGEYRAPTTSQVVQLWSANNDHTSSSARASSARRTSEALAPAIGQLSLNQQSYQQQQQLFQQQPRPQAPPQPAPLQLPYSTFRQYSQPVYISQAPLPMGLLQKGLMQQNFQNLHIQTGQAAICLPQGLLPIQADAMAAAALQQQYQQQIQQHAYQQYQREIQQHAYQQYQRQMQQHAYHQQQHSSQQQPRPLAPPEAAPPQAAPPPQPPSSKFRQSSQPVITTQAQKSPSKMNPVYQSEPRPTEKSPEEVIQIKELEQFIEIFRNRRKELGFTQKDVALTLGELTGKYLHRTSIGHFESFDLSVQNMCEMKQLLTVFMEDTDALLSNTHPSRKIVHTMPESNGWRRNVADPHRHNRVGTGESLPAEHEMYTSDDIAMIDESIPVDKEVRESDQQPSTER